MENDSVNTAVVETPQVGVEAAQETNKNNPLPGNETVTSTRPDYIPQQYWNNERNEVNLESMATDLKKFRAALSTRGQDVPDSPDGYTFSDIDLPAEIKGDIQAYAHKLGLSKHQAEALFGKDSNELEDKILKYYDEKDAKNSEAELREYVTQEVESFGGPEKVKEAVQRMDNMFIVAKNKGLLSDEEIASFKHSAIRDANTLRTFDKIVGLFNNMTNMTTINAGGGMNNTAGAYSNMDRKQIVNNVVEQLSKAHSQAEKDKIYNSLAGLR